MEIAKNQKGFNKLVISGQIWNEIIRADNKVIVAYGSNGRGKSTIKDLFQQTNLTKNFEMENEEQINLFNSTFGQSKFLVYDETFVNSFVYSEDGLKKNQMKVILKTDEITAIINNKKLMNETIGNIINGAVNFLTKIDNIEKTLNIKSSGAVTAPQKRFATTFIEGALPSRYEEIMQISDLRHKSWWFEGLGIYKRNNLSFCPWCKTDYNVITDEVKAQIDAVRQVNDIDSKLFSDKTSKTTDLQALITNYLFSQDAIDKINEVIAKTNDSIESNNEEEIISIMRALRGSLDHDREIFNEIISKVKYIDNILEIEGTDLENKLGDLTLFSTTDGSVVAISAKINDFITNIHQLVTNIKNSNQQLINSIGASEEQINELLQSLGLKYKIEIDSTKVIDSEITETEEYIVLKSNSGVDVSSAVSKTLSYGEKSTLAFAIFIQQIRNSSGNDTIIIFDDPISSYDIFRRYTTISVLNTLRGVDYQKIVILTHESNFLLSIINNIKTPTMKKLLLKESSVSEIEMVEIDSDYIGEINLYKGMIDGSNPNIRISQSILALRQLHDLYKFITGSSKLSFYDYVCKLVHYRKDDPASWDNAYSADLQTLYNYFGVTYDTNIEQIQNETMVFSDIDALYSEIIAKDVYNITLEDLCSFRMISEATVRNESTDVSRFKKAKQSLWNIDDSIKKGKLENYRALLNSISHIDDDEMAWPTLCLEDLKAIPRLVISQIMDILR